ncbi:MAG TPA: hypothetical protein VEW95_02220 [Candidatus Limnocylindrales bacterium]|nr:hypothetical protein [Candidatus Limnocylindrales bacterium]
MTPQALTSSGRLLATIGVAAAALFTMAAPVHAQDLGQDCTNPDDGYSVAYPTGWYANERVEGGEADDVAACRFFSPEEFVVVPASQATNIAVAIGVQQDGPPTSGEQTTVGERPATRIESVAPEGGFEPAGTQTYAYWIDLGDGTWLLASTSDGPNWTGDYEENKATLDAMMESLAFDDGGMLPDTAIEAGSHPPIGPALVSTGLLLVAFASAAIGLRARRPAR